MTYIYLAYRTKIVSRSKDLGIISLMRGGKSFSSMILPQERTEIKRCIPHGPIEHNYLKRRES